MPLMVTLIGIAGEQAAGTGMVTVSVWPEPLPPRVMEKGVPPTSAETSKVVAVRLPAVTWRGEARIAVDGGDQGRTDGGRGCSHRPGPSRSRNSSRW